MFIDELNNQEGSGIGGTVEEIEEVILRYSWLQTNTCPECDCESKLLIGCETPTESRIVEVPECEVCDDVVRSIAGRPNLE